jgi:hypothetical protein
VEVVAVEQDRPIGRQRIERRGLGRRLPRGVVPAAADERRGARGQSRERHAHARQRRVARVAAVQVRLPARARPGHEVDVRVHESGRDRAAVRVHDVLDRARVPERGRRPDGRDAAALHEHGVARERPSRPGPAVHDEQRRAHAGSATTGFSSVPTPSTVIATESPGSIGAIPAGVPVAITSPGSSVTKRLT